MLSILLSMLIFSSCTSDKKNIQSDVILTTADNVIIKGTYYPGNSADGMILMHGIGEDRHVYGKFAIRAQENNISAIAIDSRGHGDSDMDYLNFKENDFLGMENDLYAAKVFLQGKGIKTIYVLGAGIGANTAINFAAHAPDVNAVIALSPSFSYEGISTRESVINLNVPMLIVVSKDDEPSFNDSQIIAKLTNADQLLLNGLDHGTKMLYNITEDKIFEWLG